MATLTDLDVKRGELNTAISAYTQAIQDLAAGSATQQDVDNNKATVIAKGDEYAKLVTQVKTDNPGLADADFYSNPTLMSDSVRSDVATIMRTGALSTALFREDFNGGTLDSTKWDTINGADNQGDFAAGHILQTAAGESSPDRLIGLSTKTRFPVGTSVRARVRNTAGRTAILIGLSNDQTEISGHGNSSRSIVWYSREDVAQTVVGSFRDENNDTDFLVLDPSDFSTYKVVEMRRVSSTRIEFYEDDVLMHVSEPAVFANDYSVIFAIDTPSANDTELHIDWVEVTALNQI